MKRIKRGLHKLTRGQITFDKLAVMMLAGLSIGLVSKGYEPMEERVALAEYGREVTSVEEGHELTVEGLDEQQLAFMDKIVPDAVEVAREYQVYPSVIVAQSILESDWGRSPLAVNANNLFGIKGTYNGSYIWHDTKEDDGTGVHYNVTDKFAKYPSYKESVESNAKLIREGLSWDEEYYSGAWVENTDNYLGATEFLTGTYATDVHYNQKVNRVIQEYNLDVLDK